MVTSSGRSEVQEDHIKKERDRLASFLKLDLPERKLREITAEIEAYDFILENALWSEFFDWRRANRMEGFAASPCDFKRHYEAK